MTILYWLILSSTIYCASTRYNSNIKSSRSQCDHCHTQLTWIELIPIASYLIQRGRCRTCNTKIDIMNLIIEIIGLCIGLFFLFFPHSPIIQVKLALYTYIFLCDALHQLIPDRAILALFIINLSRPSFILILFCLFLCIFVYFQQFGFGDVKLIFVSGLKLSFLNLNFVLLLSSLLSLISIFILVSIKKTTSSSPFPFGCAWVVSLVLLSHLI